MSNEYGDYADQCPVGKIPYGLVLDSVSEQAIPLLRSSIIKYIEKALVLENIRIEESSWRDEDTELFVKFKLPTSNIEVLFDCTVVENDDESFTLLLDSPPTCDTYTGDFNDIYTKNINKISISPSVSFK